MLRLFKPKALDTDTADGRTAATCEVAAMETAGAMLEVRAAAAMAVEQRRCSSERGRASRECTDARL